MLSQGMMILHGAGFEISFLTKLSIGEITDLLTENLRNKIIEEYNELFTFEAAIL